MSEYPASLDYIGGGGQNGDPCKKSTKTTLPPFQTGTIWFLADFGDFFKPISKRQKTPKTI